MPTSRRPLADRFWEKVNKNGPWSPFFGPPGGEESTQCWLWTGSRSGSAGYGYIGADGRNGKVLRAHRVSWTLLYGEIPEGYCVLHMCDVPHCVRPSHLALGTQLDNIADREKKGRGVVPCR